VAASWIRLTNSLDVWGRNGNTVNSVFAQIGTLDNLPLNFVVNSLRSGQLHPNGDVLFGLGAGNILAHTKPKHIGIGRRAMGNALEMEEGTIAIGDSALFNNGQGASIAGHGINNIAIGPNTLVNNTIGNRNVAIGHTSLRQNVSGYSNTAIGALNMTQNTFGAENTALGAYTMQANQTGGVNIAIGNYTLNSNVSGSFNIALGKYALYANTTKNNLLAIGDSALFNNGTGATTAAQAINNVAIGNLSLYNNTTGSSNTALGYKAGYENITGDRNVSVGFEAGNSNRFGFSNTAIGHQAFFSNHSGNSNTAVGDLALSGNNGNDNVAIGTYTLFDNVSGNRNTAIGRGALGGVLLDTGSGKIAIGYNAGFNEATSNKLYIENSSANKDNALIYGDFAADSLQLNAKTLVRDKLGVKGAGGNTGIELGYEQTKESNAGRLGYGLFTPNTIDFVGGGTAFSTRAIKFWAEGGSTFTGKVIPASDNAYSLGQSGNRWSTVWAASGVVSTSDARLKTNITTSPYGLQEVLEMNPVQYNWKENPNADLQIGFLAQDIQKIIPEAVVVPTNGDPMGMKYTELIPVLVKGMQEQQALIITLQKTNAELQKRLEKLEHK
jgi:trimeric autotransporter adhesin